MEQTVDEARSKGYTETLFGRRRSLPDLHSPNRNLRMAAERQAMNAGIQGLAADLFKVALVRLDGALEDQGLAARLVLQVHDEVLLEVPAAEEETVAALVPEVLGGRGRGGGPGRAPEGVERLGRLVGRRQGLMGPPEPCAGDGTQPTCRGRAIEAVRAIW